MRLLRDTFNAIRNKIGNSNQPRKVKPTAAKAAQDARAFARQAEEISRYIWRNPGLNRHERRSLAAQIGRKRLRKRTKKMQSVMNDAETKIAKFKLKNRIRNFPAVCRRHLNAFGQTVKRFVTNNPYYKGENATTKW